MPRLLSVWRFSCVTVLAFGKVPIQQACSLALCTRHHTLTNAALCSYQNHLLCALGE